METIKSIAAVLVVSAAIAFVTVCLLIGLRGVIDWLFDRRDKS